MNNLYIKELISVLSKTDFTKIEQLAEKIKKFINTDKTIFICGNGGNSVTASHIACDLSKTILGKDPKNNNKRLRVISLSDSVSLMSAWANDEGYEYIFSEQLKTLGKKNDLLIVLTGSGNSKNILQAIKEAKKMNIETFGILGNNGGKVKKNLDDYFSITSTDPKISENISEIINHLITDYLSK